MVCAQSWLCIKATLTSRDSQGEHCCQTAALSKVSLNAKKSCSHPTRAKIEGASVQKCLFDKDDPASELQADAADRLKFIVHELRLEEEGSARKGQVMINSSSKSFAC